jgi:phage/plasmid-like protein (TIGR03299 family)
MSHEIEQMAYVGQVPWHGLGNSIPEDTDIEQWRIAAGLDWTVSKRPVQFNAPDRGITFGGIPVSTFKNKFVLARDTDNRPYAVVSDRYKPVQPKEILEFFRELIARFDMKIETAGSLRDGQRVWALAKTGDAHKVLGVDQVDSYLMLATSYDLTFSTLAQFTSVRVVCNNTLQASLANFSGRVSIPHFREFSIDDVHDQMGLGRENWQAFARTLDVLAQLKLDVAKASTVLHSAFDITADPKRDDTVNLTHCAKIIQLFEGKGIGSNIAGQTGWGLVNATTEYFDHHKRARNSGNRLDSAWFGDGFNTKQRVLDNLVELAA